MALAFLNFFTRPSAKNNEALKCETLGVVTKNLMYRVILEHANLYTSHCANYIKFVCLLGVATKVSLLVTP